MARPVRPVETPEQKRLRYKRTYKCVPYGPYLVRYTIHDAHKGTIFYQTFTASAATIEEAKKIKAPATGHIVGIYFNLEKFYRRRPVSELFD